MIRRFARRSVRDLVVRSAGLEQPLPAHRRGSKPAKTVALPSFRGIVGACACSCWQLPLEGAPAAEPELAEELEAPAVAENEDRSTAPPLSTDP